MDAHKPNHEDLKGKNLNVFYQPNNKDLKS